MLDHNSYIKQDFGAPYFGSIFLIYLVLICMCVIIHNFKSFEKQNVEINPIVAITQLILCFNQK